MENSTFNKGGYIINDKISFLNYIIIRHDFKDYFECINSDENVFQNINCENKDKMYDYNFEDGSKKYDLIFIDSLENYELYKTKINFSLLSLKENGILVVDLGDIEKNWKAIVSIRKERNDIKLYTLEDFNNLCIITKGNSEFECNSTISSLREKDFRMNRNYYMNYITLDNFIRNIVDIIFDIRYDYEINNSSIINIDYHITDRCNLNCVSCNHFCSLLPSNTKHKTMEQIRSDLTLLSKIKDNIQCLSLMGGEPTLHPNLNEILYLTRKLFPNTEIHLTTNGTRYKEFLFWKDAIIKNNIIVVLSRYPYKENFDESYKEIEKMIPNNVIISTGEGYMYNMMVGALINKPLVNEYSIRHCRMRGACCQLRNGRIYICNTAANFEFFDNYFKGKHTIERDEYDYVDLSKVNTFKDVFNLLYINVPKICEYCRECERTFETSRTTKWKKSEQDISEWYTEV